jgi:integrase
MARGDGSVFQRGSRWFAQWYGPDPSGEAKRFRGTAGDSEKEARAFLREKLREVGNHRAGQSRYVPPSAAKLTLGALLDDVVGDYVARGLHSLQPAVAHMKPVRAALGARAAQAISSDEITRYIGARKEAGASLATIDRELELVKRAFSLARRNGKAAFAPYIPRVCKANSNAREGFLDEPEFKAILAEIPDTDFRDVLRWQFLTGMRHGEIGKLGWAAYDATTETIRLAAKDAKTGRARSFPLYGELAKIIKRRKARRLTALPLIFHSKGRSVLAPTRGAGYTSRLRAIWRDATKRAGYEGIVPYDLRRTAVRNLSAAGVPERVIMAISGHETRAVFDRYRIVDERDVRGAFESLARFLAAKGRQKRKVVPFSRTAPSQPQKGSHRSAIP